MVRRRRGFGDTQRGERFLSRRSDSTATVKKPLCKVILVHVILNLNFMLTQDPLPRLLCPTGSAPANFLPSSPWLPPLAPTTSTLPTPVLHQATGPAFTNTRRHRDTLRPARQLPRTTSLLTTPSSHPSHHPSCSPLNRIINQISQLRKGRFAKIKRLIKRLKALSKKLFQSNSPFIHLQIH